MRNRISFRDIYDPEIRSKLIQMIAQLKIRGFKFVSSIIDRLFSWVDGNARGQFILDHFKDLGFYYLVVLGRSMATDGKITLNYKLVNLFDDKVAFQSFERFKPSPDTRLETQNYYNAGFRFFQEQGDPANGHIYAHWDSLVTPKRDFKVMFVRSSNEFDPSKIQIQPGILPGGNPPVAVIPDQKSPAKENIMETLKETFNNNPMYFVLGAGLILYFAFKD